MPSTRTMIDVATERLEALRQTVQGEVFAPEDAGYEEARLAWNRVVDQYPALIVRAANAADVVEAVRFARAEDLPIAVQATGHGVVNPADGALLVLTSRLNELAIDPETQTAWIGAGLKWGEVLTRAQEHGLAPLLGSSPDVGAVGYTLGGGMGWLARKYGMAIDSVLRFEVVTADGRLIEASETKNSDLFWALRGGGGGFGVVTGMEIRLYPVSTVYGGDMLYPIEVAKEVYQRYRDWIASAPDELTTSIVTMNFPSLPQIPEFLRGKSGVILRGCYVGPLEQGEALVKYWLDWMPPIMSSFRAMPFLEVASISKDPEEPVPGVSSGSWLSDLDDETIDTILRYTLPQEGLPPLLVATEVRHTGGAIARVHADANALGHRDAPLALSVVALTPTPERKEQVEAYIAEFKQALAPHIPGVFLNFLGKDEADEHTVDAFSTEAYHRLQRVKAAYDPENFFRFAYPVPPDREA
jgi:hypothetical protein